MSRIILPRRDLIAPSKRLQRGSMVLDAFRFGVPNPQWVNTVLQLHFDGATIVDSSSYGQAISGGSLRGTSTTQHKFGTHAGRFNSLNSYVIVDADPSLIIGTDDFWLSFQAYLENSSGQQILFDSRNLGNGSGGFLIDSNSGVLRYYDGVSIYSSGVSPTLNTWLPIDFVRVSGQVYLFIDGTLVLSRADAKNYSNDSYLLGAASYTPVGVANMLGYLDECRMVINGSGSPTSNFTPPTAPYVDGP